MKRASLVIILSALLLTGAGCGQGRFGYPEPGPAPAAEQAKKASVGVADVCGYFPKELVEAAIGKPIAKVEVPIMGQEYCAYYTEYRADYNYAPGGNTPGGPSIQVVHEKKSVAVWKAEKEQGGSKTEKDSAIPMDNFVVRNRTGKIWQAVLVLGSDEYLRMHFIDDAVDGSTLVKIAAKFAEKINSK